MPEHPSDDDTVFQTMFGQVGAAGSTVAFGAAVFLIAESALLTAVLAALMGVGSYFLLPWVLSLEEEEVDAEEGASESHSMGATTTTSGFELHRGAVGVACETGAIVGFAAYFVLEEPLLAAGIGVVAPLVEYPILSFVLPEGSS